jgi:uncharacterized protein (TIGR03437 family)
MSVAGNAPNSVTVKSDQPWLLAPAGGNIPLVIAPAFVPGSLGEAVYHGALTVTPRTGSPIIVPVTYDLSNKPQVVVSTTTLNFRYQIADPLPAPQVISLTSSSINPAIVQVGTSGAQWMTVTMSQYATPAQLTVMVDPTGLDPGSYTAVIYVYNTGGPGQIGVTLNVSNPPVLPTSLARVVNAASLQSGEIAPGEILTLSGITLGPDTAVTASPDGNGLLPTALAGTAVLFDGIPAPILSTSSQQVSAIAPYEIGSKTRTSISVQYQGASSAPATLSVSDASPALFTSDSSGTGPCDCQNFQETDSTYSPNTAANPSIRGGVVVLRGTGEGLLTPTPVTGSIAMEPLPTLTLPISVSIGGSLAEILYAGPALGQPYGFFQIKVRIPVSAPSGAVPVTLQVGSNTSRSGVTLAVQ